MLLASLLILSAPVTDETVQRVELSESPAARAWAAVGASTVPAALDAEVVAALAEGPFRSSTWELWGARLWAAHEADGPQLRAALCLVAREQGRDFDAWQHYARLVADPSQAAALRHHLWPGVPLEFPAEVGGRSPELPEGVLLRPLLPQPSGAWAQEYSFAAVLNEMRESHMTGLRVAGATLELRLSVESTGVKLQTWLRDGPSRELRVWMPEPPGYSVDIEYVDWLKVEGRHAPRSLTPPPGDEPWVLFSRVSERDVERPDGAVERLPAGLALGGLLLEDAAPQEEQRGELQLPASEILARLIGVEVRSVHPAAAAPEGFRGVRVQVPARGEARERTLRYLAGALEGWILRD